MLQARARLVLFLPLLSLSYSLSSNTPFNGEIRQHINPVKFRTALIDDNLTHWLHATSTSNGFYQTNLNRRWQPYGEQTATLVSQTRLLYVLGVGYELTGDAAYREAVVRGADFFLKHFHDNKYNGWYWRVSPKGEVLDDRKDTYGHAFAVFGLSHAYRVTKDPRYRRAALDTWQVIKTELRDSNGGYVTEADRAFVKRKSARTQNPIMHLFEALLVLYDATGQPAILKDAEAIEEFVVNKLYQPEKGWIPELYNAEWQPIPQDQGGHIDIGHQFEWSFLLSQAVGKGMPAGLLDIGNRLLNSAIKLGYNATTGSVYNTLGYDKHIQDAGTGWWQQCELIRSLMRYATLHKRDDLWTQLDRALLFADRKLIDHEYGGWYPAATGEVNKGSVWKVGYHVTGMYSEGLKLADDQSKRH
jgi:mannobiose 2-epimerase